MKIVGLLFVFYFLLLNMIPCLKQLESSETTSCCSRQLDKADEKEHNQPEEGCLACNPLGSCDCCPTVFFSKYSFNFPMVPVYQVKNGTYCEFIPSIITSSVWQPPKTV